MLQKDPLTAVTDYSYQTMHYLFEQSKALPNVTKSFVAHDSTKTAAKHILRITYEDLIPLVLVTYGNQIIQEHGNAYLSEENDQFTFPGTLVLQTGLHLLEVATWLFKVRKNSQLFVRTAIVTLEAPLLFNQNRSSPLMTICSDAHCSTLRFVQGSLRDIVTYYSTELAIYSIRYLPFAGNLLASFLSTYHNGRYLVSVALPEMCNRHQVLYLSQHSELALSLGIGHALSARVINSVLETLTRIPQSYYASTIEQLLFISHMNVAAHLTLPNPPITLTRRVPDPIHLFQSTIGFVFDALLVGLKTKVPSLLPGNQVGGLKQAIKNLPWEEVRALHLWVITNPKARIFLPKLLHDLPSFLNDPIIKSNWPALKQSFLTVLNTLESLSQNRTIRLSSYIPGVTSALAEKVSGTPRVITSLGLQLITDPEFINVVVYLKARIEQLAQLEQPRNHTEIELSVWEDYIVVEREESTPVSHNNALTSSRYRLHSSISSSPDTEGWEFVDHEPYCSSQS
ncbi:hypothetical protein [Legionella impletisoli]|uniref:Uncharacterized protein n=1 Tax=Legionella impletisoli TaxID=343510 RepID=A0A917JLM5_9GAMM|nr:hypothetical protein [Legionella impletisoli]GGI76259.1 hypothetical protein GCM10007966_01390 [Legionella impletisoli]